MAVKSPQKGIFSNSSVSTSHVIEELLTVLTATCRETPHDDEEEKETEKRAKERGGGEVTWKERRAQIRHPDNRV